VQGFVRFVTSIMGSKLIIAFLLVLLIITHIQKIILALNYALYLGYNGVEA
jgi:hypothetical protein